MSFLWPVMLVFLLLIPLSVVLYRRLLEQRRRQAASYGSFGIMQAANGRQLGKRRHIPHGLFLAGLCVLLVALARPQAVVSLPQVEGTVILAFDVSGSMIAQDIEPTRMDAAKTVAREFVKRQPPTVQIGVVAFSEGGFAVQAPTNDQGEVLAAIERIVPQRGTSIGQGILASLNTIAADSQQGSRRYSTLTPTPNNMPTRLNRSAVIVLLTDGENTSRPDPLEIAQAAAERQVRIYTVGIGSPGGITLEVNGFSVHSQLDEVTLQQIAEATNGTYYNAASQQDLRTIYNNLELQLVVKPEPMEITALLAGLGVVLLLIGAACSMLWFSRVP